MTTCVQVLSVLCRLGYLGLGEILCFVAFGPLAVTASFLTHALPHAAGATAPAYVQANAAAVTPVALSLGLTTSIILFCSHFHQIKGDKQAGKMSPLVRLGTRRGCQVCAPWIAFCRASCSRVASVTFVCVHEQKSALVQCMCSGEPHKEA